jgi:tetratricopeptide (TPR) repeat protein
MVISKFAITVCLFIFFSSIISIHFKQAKEEGLLNLFSISSLIVDRSRIDAKARNTTLNQWMPSFDYLAGWVKNESLFEKEPLKKCVRYYNKVIDYYPQISAAHEMLGFCYYRLGERDKAISYYNKAIILNPHFFWSYYNLGVIYLKESGYDKAAYLFKKGMNVKPDITMKEIANSKIYQQIRSAKNFNYAVDSKLKEGYKKCYKLLVLSQYLKNHPPENERPNFSREEIDIRIF